MATQTLFQGPTEEEIWTMVENTKQDKITITANKSHKTNASKRQPKGDVLSVYKKSTE